MSSLKDKEFQMVGCLGKHASYTFYKSIRVGERTLSLSNFFPVRIWPDSAILSIAEVQLLWKDRNESLCSLRLYFLPENTPYGRFSFHGEDEVIALQDKVIIRASDLMTWIVDEQDWDWGFLTPSSKEDNQQNVLSKAFMSEKYGKEDKLMEFSEPRANSVVVLNYERYVRLRSVLKRLEGAPDLNNWLNHPLVMAIGGLPVGPNCRILFARDVFDYPDLEDHELLCNHLAPKLKGRPRKKKRTRNPSVGSVSNESESSSTGSCGSSDKGKSKKPLNGLSTHSNVDKDLRISSLSKAAKIMEERGLDGVHKELVFGNNANGLQILKVDSSQMLKNGQISAHGVNSGAMKRPYNQTGSGSRRVVDGRSSGGAASSAMNLFDGKQLNADLLGPGLSELAQKLKKSNALQILAIKPQFGSGRDVGVDYDMFQLKRMKMDPDVEQSLRFNSDVLISPFNTGPFTSRKHTIYSAPIIDKVVSKTHDIVKQMVGFSHSQKSSTNSKINQHQKPQKQPVVTATIDATAAIVMPIPSCTDSPFRTRYSIQPVLMKIYPDPTKQPEVPRKHFSHLPKEASTILDFSLRKRQPPEVTRRSANPRSTPETDLLDLTVRASASGTRGNAYSRHASDMSLPSPMDKLGLQLTSEVTLFPSPSAYVSRVKESSHSKSSNKGAPASMGSSSSNAIRHHHQESIPGSSRKSLRSPSASAVIQGASGVAAMGSPSPKDTPMRHHLQQQHYPNHLNTKPLFGPSDRGIIPGLSTSQGHSGSAITIKPMNSEEKLTAAKLKELEKAYQQSMPAPPFMPSAPFMPKMDPTYLSLLANPFLMSPQALMSIPGAMEQFQMYKELLSQTTGIPQLPLHWPPSGPGNERGPK